jgi:uncharacterized protein (DUF1697 family)
MVRTAAQWSAIVAANPFREVAVQDPGRLVLMAMKDAPTRAQLDSLLSAHGGPEVIRTDGRQLYLHYVNGIGRSKLTNALIEKHLATRATGRNWNTVRRIDEIMRASP